MSKMIGDTPAEDWGRIVEIEQVSEQDRETLGGPYPIVFHFRPNRFIVVSDDKREDWAKHFEANVGALPKKPTLDRRLLEGWSGDPKETISGSNSDWDDSDYW